MAKGLSMTGAGGSSISGIAEIDRALSKLEKNQRAYVLWQESRQEWLACTPS